MKEFQRVLLADLTRYEADGWVPVHRSDCGAVGATEASMGNLQVVLVAREAESPEQRARRATDDMMLDLALEVARAQAGEGAAEELVRLQAETMLRRVAARLAEGR